MFYWTISGKAIFERIMEDTREYIRLSEVEKLTNLTHEQVLDAVELGTFELSAWISASGAGGVDKYNELLVIFDVNAIVTLSNSQSRELLSGELRLKRFSANNIKALQNISSVAKRFPNALKGEFSGVREGVFASKELKEVVAPIFATVPTVDSLNAAFNRNFNAEEFKASAKEDKVQALLSGLTTMTTSLSQSAKQLQTGFFSLKPEDIRLDRHRLNQYFNQTNRTDNALINSSQSVKRSVNHIASSQSNQGCQPNIVTHPIEQIILRVLRVYPHARVSEVWNLIKRDCQLDINRQFDDEGIVSFVTNDTLGYFGVGTNSEKKITREYFRKKLFYAVNKKLKKTSP
ncbi:hypothetical protein [Vibrio cionasavignyae]|uniref:hypothetical protein n=1 Tax=Vibrio cionasavignyae TaxID=2910252 RepID=UPI003D114D22